MNEGDLHILQQWFFGYVHSYYTGEWMHDATIRLKEEHTGRVCEEIRLLGRALGLSSDDLRLAETMALFHDIGRFEQFERYGTFKDAASTDHGALGLRQVHRHGVLWRLGRDDRALVYRAIRYHNRRSVPEMKDGRVLFFIWLLRDADKLDILNIFVRLYEGDSEGITETVTWHLPDEPVYSPKIVDALLREEMADARDMRTLCDYKLLQISWVYDLHFAVSCRQVHRRRYIDRIAATLPRRLSVDGAVQKVCDYLADRQQASDDQKTH